MSEDEMRMFKDIQLSLEANFKRIEKLEKGWQGLKNLVEEVYQLKGPNIEKELAELKAGIVSDDWIATVNGYNHKFDTTINKLQERYPPSWGDQVETEIGELKEQINHLKEQKHVWARERNDIREALWEFFNKMVKHYQSKEDKTFEYWEGFFLAMIDTLGEATPYANGHASSASHTEKSCNNCGWFEDGYCRNKEATVHADGGLCWKEKEDSKLDLNITGLTKAEYRVKTQEIDELLTGDKEKEPPEAPTCLICGKTNHINYYCSDCHLNSYDRADRMGGNIAVEKSDLKQLCGITNERFKREMREKYLKTEERPPDATGKYLPGDDK